MPSRAEFERLSRTVRELADRLAATEKELEIQFTRIADIQAELDGPLSVGSDETETHGQGAPARWLITAARH